jgi:hypothetical protein
MKSAFDYIDAIIARLDQPTVDRDDLMLHLGEEVGRYLEIVEFRPAHDAFSDGELLLYHPNENVFGVRLTVASALTPDSFIERFGPTKRGSTNNINTHYSMQWFVGKSRGSLNRACIDVSWEGLVQRILMTREHE